MRKSGMKRLTVSLLAAALLSACAVGPDYVRPQTDLPAAWAAGQDAAETVELSRWWLSFNDAKLNALIDEALQNNADLKIAVARVDEAAAQLRLARAQYYPSVDAQLGASRAQSSLDTGAPQMPGVPRTMTTYRGGLVLDYELDLWGRIRRSNEASLATLAANQAARDAVQAAVAAQVAQSHFEGLALDKQIALLGRTLATREENLKLQRKRLDAGLISPYDFAQSENETAAIASSLPTLIAARSKISTALSVLRGASPRSMSEDAAAPREIAEVQLPAAPQVPMDLPSTLLERRPDIRQAEQQLIAANAGIGEAKADYFPKISLSGFFGGASETLSDLFSSPARTWEAALGLAQPIVSMNRVDAQVNAAEARERAAKAQYAKTVQTAFKDSYDALVTLNAARETQAAQLRRVQALNEAYRVAELRYKAGRISYLELLDVERQLRGVEQEQVAAQRDQLNATVDLYRALGGGWTAG